MSGREKQGERAAMSDKPKRIQRKRSKGWKMPENAVYVGRPTRWGNPFRVGSWAKLGDGKQCLMFLVGVKAPGFTYLETPEQAVEFFREMRRRYPASEINYLRPLRGKDLACWCPLDKPCHADVLLEIANVAGGASVNSR